MLQPVHYEEYNWLGDEWSGGAYTAVMAPGGLTEFHKYVPTQHQIALIFRLSCVFFCHVSSVTNLHIA